MIPSPCRLAAGLELLQKLFSLAGNTADAAKAGAKAAALRKAVLEHMWDSKAGPSSRTPFRVSFCAARTLTPEVQSQIVRSQRYEHLRAAG